MKYAYSHLYDVDVPLPKTSMFWERMIDRALKSMAREKLRLGTISLDRTLLLWQIYARDTVVEHKPKLNSIGRHTLIEFREWLESVNLVGVSIPRAIPIQLREREVLELTTTADLAYNDGGIKLVRIATAPTIIESAVLAEDDTPWALFNPVRKTWLNPTPRDWLAPTLQQISRSMFRNIIWPNPDGRCNRCPYSGICSYEDVNSTKDEVNQRLTGGIK